MLSLLIHLNIRYAHKSIVLDCDMKLSVFVPDRNDPHQKLSAIFFLSGLTCNEDNFITKAGAIKRAAEKDCILICPDTSPRGLNIDGDSDAWDFGVGAGFYLNATNPKWKNYQMYSYITEELYELVLKHLPVDPQRISIFGHSMGGHGALTIALKNPEKFRSVSAFAPIVNPIDCPWGQKAFFGYLDPENKEEWKQYDTIELMKTYKGRKMAMLVDQGSSDSFLENQLKSQRMERIASENDRFELTYRLQEGYDHSYWFIQTFVDDHIDFHVNQMQ